MSFAFPIQVPYYQFDQQGVAFNMWYLAWFDEAMAGFLGSIGSPYHDLVDGGVDVQLVHTEIDWNGAVRYGDLIHVEVTTGSIGTTSFSLAFAVAREGATLATALTVYVVVTTDGAGKRAIPAALRAGLERS